MSLFTEPSLKLEFFDAEGRDAALLQSIIYQIGYKGSGIILTIPKGFVSDGVSVPQILWWFIPPWGSKASKAALVHDYLISLLKAGTPFPGFETREAIDREFRIALLALGVSRFRAEVAYLAISSYTLRLKLFPKN